jgi:hypothetical protein
MPVRTTVLLFIAPILLSLILHLHVFSYDLIGYHVWRQSQTQTVIYNFQHADNDILNPQRFDLGTGTTSLLYEFPLYQWLVAQYNAAFGYNVAHSRAASFLVFGFFLLGFFLLLRSFAGNEVALVTNHLLCFSPLLYYYCVNPIPDVLALCLAIWGLYCFFRFHLTGKIRWFIMFSALISLAALVKLPYILFCTVFFLFCILHYRKEKNRVSVLSIVFLLFMAPVYFWYARAIPTWSGNPITSGITGNEAGLLQLLDYLQFTILSSTPELLTNYASCIFLFIGLYLVAREKRIIFPVNYLITLLVAFIAYYLYEINLIAKVHDYYLLPFVPFIFLVIASAIKRYIKRLRLLLVVVLLAVPVTAWLRIDQRWNLEDPGFHPDYLRYSGILKQIIPAESLCVIDSDPTRFVCLYYLKRKGFSLQKNELSEEKLHQLYAKGATILLTEDLRFEPSEFKGFDFVLLFNNKIRAYRFSKL